MGAPSMASLERSLQNFSLNNSTNQIRQNSPTPSTTTTTTTSSDNVSVISDFATTTTTLELNSNLSLPYHWEQCLDLKTGEIYYINWRTGMKVKEDPRLSVETDEDFYSDDDDEDDDDDGSSYDSGVESSSETSPSSRHYNDNGVEKVLVVAGCKGCMMYVMVPKLVEDCPKCSGQLLHFDRPENEPSS